MPGLPFGAAQQHEVPEELQSYEGIAGIEFIEICPDLPYPRSFAYRPTSKGAQVRTRLNAPELHDADLTVTQARNLIDALVEAGIFQWQRVYRAAQGSFVVAGVEWRLEITFAKQGIGKAPKPFKVEGENVYPDNYEQIIALFLDKERQRDSQGDEAV